MSSGNSPIKHSWTKEILKYVISIVIIGCGVASYAYLASLAEKPANVDPTSLIPLVKTYQITPYSGSLDKEVSGTVVPFREVDVAAEVGGKIIEKSPVCEAGKFVKKGTELFKIDPTEWELERTSTLADIRQAEETINEVKQEYENAEANLKLVDAEVQLQQQDYDRNLEARNALSQSELNAAERNLLNAKNRQQQARNTLTSLAARKRRLEATLDFTKTKLNRIELNLERTTVKAPASGIIVQEMAEQGNVIRAGDRLVKIEDTSQAEVLCNLTTSDLNWVRRYSTGEEMVESEDLNMASIYRIPKTQVKITDRATQNAEWEGVLERFDGVGRDEVTKTFPVRIVVESPVVMTTEGPSALVKGMYVKCRMQVEASAAGDRQYVSFPTLGLRPGNCIWVVRNKKLRRIPVSVVDHTTVVDEDEKGQPYVIALLENGLKVGDQLVISPLSQPTEGGEVQFESDLEAPSAAENGGDSAVADADSDPERAAAKTAADLDSTDDRG